MNIWNVVYMCLQFYYLMCLLVLTRVFLSKEGKWFTHCLLNTAYLLHPDEVMTYLPCEAAMLACLGIVILSVCLSVTRVLCDETKEHTDEILTIHESVINLVFWHQTRLVGDVHFHLKFALNDAPLFEKRRLWPISAYNVWTVRPREKCSIIANRNRPRAFQRTIHEVGTLPLTPPKGGSKSKFVIFVNKILVQSKKVCYKVYLPFLYNAVC